MRRDVISRFRGEIMTCNSVDAASILIPGAVKTEKLAKDFGNARACTSAASTNAAVRVWHMEENAHPIGPERYKG